MRSAGLERNTKETEIRMNLELDGSGTGEIDTGVGFLDHMLTLLVKNAGFDMTVYGKGDTYVDDHHTVEDTGIVFGEVFKKALGDKRGIKRYGDRIIPMDEALALVAIDISGRDFVSYEVDGLKEKVGTFDTELAEEFVRGFARAAGITIHVKKLAGENSHHILEAVFKAIGRALRDAVEIDDRTEGEIPSTKGVL